MTPETLEPDDLDLSTLSNARLGFLFRLCEIDVSSTTHEAIAKAMNLTLFAVRVALKDLRTKGFISTRTHTRGVEITINKPVKEKLNKDVNNETREKTKPPSRKDKSNKENTKDKG